MITKKNNVLPVIKSKRSMFKEAIYTPFLIGLDNLLEYITVKAVIIASSWPVLYSLDLFSTPRQWWHGLFYLVILDWLAGVSKALYNNNFDAAIAVQKWYSVFSYMIVCGSVAILSNSFDLLYYFQFVVYLTFYLKEFISILRTYKMLVIIQTVWIMIIDKDFAPDRFDEIKKSLDERAKSIEKEHTD